MAKVTIWLTSYNHENFLPKTIDSIISQTFQDFELVIIDDHSTDNSAQIIKKYEQKYKNITSIIHEKNMGGSFIDERIMNYSSDYVAIAHSDDLWAKDKLEKQVEYMENHKECAGCFTQVALIDEEDQQFLDENHPYFSIFNKENRSRFEWLRFFFDNGNCLCHPSLLIRKSMYKDKKIKSNGLSALPDFYRWIKICLDNDIYIIPEKLTMFRIRKDDSKQDSGDTEYKNKQLYVEEFLVYKEYFHLKDKNDILKVFPESEKYFLGREYIPEFVVSKCMLHSHKQVHQLLGIEKIYELLNNPVTAKQLLEFHSYDKKSFSQDKQKYDPFHMIDDSRYLMSSIYVDVGNGFNENDKITKKTYVKGNKTVQVTFNLTDNFDINNILQIRFDPYENAYNKMKITECVDEDNNIIEIIPINGIDKDGIVSFFTADPQYVIKQKCSMIKLVFYIEKIQYYEIETYFLNVKNNYENQLAIEIEKNTGVFKKLLKKIKGKINIFVIN